MKLTLSGLAFEIATDEEEVDDQLFRLGMSERYSTTSRTLAEACEMMGELRDSGASDQLAAKRWMMGEKVHSLSGSSREIAEGREGGGLFACGFAEAW